VRTVDATQYANRLHHYDFDMTVALFGQSEAPGTEQRHYWGSAAADTPGGRNLAGVRDPAVDAAVQLLIEAKDRDSLVARTRALDRLLQWGYYAVPHWHTKIDRVAYRSWLARPARSPKNGVDITTWWAREQKTRITSR
jgi:microcin C transport system substrate-binding protein